MGAAAKMTLSDGSFFPVPVLCLVDSTDAIGDARRIALRDPNVEGNPVLAVMDVESRFDRYAVSYAGAVGLMQVMPFWPSQLGMGNEQLIRIPENVRMGTTILGYYLRKERGNYPRALQRYNGSLGRPTYSDLVIDRLVSRWRYGH